MAENGELQASGGLGSRGCLGVLRKIVMIVVSVTYFFNFHLSLLVEQFKGDFNWFFLLLLPVIFNIAPTMNTRSKNTAEDNLFLCA